MEMIRWVTKDNITICKSAQHRDMFIFNYPNGKFFTITGSYDVLLRIHPPK